MMFRRDIAWIFLASFFLSARFALASSNEIVPICAAAIATRHVRQMDKLGGPAAVASSVLLAYGRGRISQAHLAGRLRGEEVFAEPELLVDLFKSFALHSDIEELAVNADLVQYLAQHEAVIVLWNDPLDGEQFGIVKAVHPDGIWLQDPARSEPTRFLPLSQFNLYWASSKAYHQGVLIRVSDRPLRRFSVVN